MNKIICLCGQTAIGKTRMAIELAETLPIHVISIDSAMIFKDMDLGTGKPDKHELAKCPHALIDLVTPEQYMDVYRYIQLIHKEIEVARTLGKIPFLVGGSFLHFKSLWFGLDKLPKRDEQIRAALQDKLDTYGFSYMQEILAAKDPESAKRINNNDHVRLIRALEIMEITGKPMSKLLTANQEMNKDFINFAIVPESKEQLKSNINNRLLDMLDRGFVAEVEAICSKYNLNESSPGLKVVGYKQIYNFISGKISKDMMIERTRIATMQLAKRQGTWLRSFKGLQCGNYLAIIGKIREL